MPVIWDKWVVSRPVAFREGLYKVIVTASGTAVSGVYPHLRLLVNGDPYAGYYVSGYPQSQTFTLRVPADMLLTFKIEMDNDAHNDKEDRNAFIQSVILIRLK